MPSLVPCITALPQSGEGQLLCQGRSLQRLPWCLASLPSPEWRGTVALPRKKSTPSLLPCITALPQSGEGQLLCQGRSQCLPWCLASPPSPRVERDSCSAKDEVNAFLGALHHRPPPEWRGTVALPRKKSTPSLVPCITALPQSGEGQLLCQGRSQRLTWCLASPPAPRVERDSCSAKEETHLEKNSRTSVM